MFMWRAVGLNVTDRSNHFQIIMIQSNVIYEEIQPDANTSNFLVHLQNKILLTYKHVTGGAAPLSIIYLFDVASLGKWWVKPF